MAERENIRAWIQKLNPRALFVLDELDRQFVKLGCRGVDVTTTEDMSPEEQQMALYEGFLKEGLPYAEAEAKACEWLSLIKMPKG